ncbi:hypothetical protein KAR91_81525 [Candidatus Pacearchaeota archaeon]|nr:hypothetical protein [Candidatus Pacearchaeota archaeon]
MFKDVTFKVGNMRKPQSFVVYPYKIGDVSIKIQSDKSCGFFNRKNGKGIMNFKSDKFPLLEAYGVQYNLDPEILKSFLDIQLYPGETILKGVMYVAGN